MLPTIRTRCLLAFALLLLAAGLAWGQALPSPSPALNSLDLKLLGALAQRAESSEGLLKRGSVDLSQSTLQYWTSAPLPADAKASYPKDTEPLAVVDHGPSGELPMEMQRPTIYVMFNLPMVPLAKLGEPITNSPLLSIDPPIKGVYRWYGTKVLSFQPAASTLDQPLYTVTVSAQASSLGGSSLGKPFSFSFNTETVKMVNLYAGKNPDQYFGESEVPTGVARSMIIEFNQPVDPAHLKRQLHVSLRKSGSETQAGFSLGRPAYPERLASRTKRAVLLTLDAEAPEDCELSVTLADGASPLPKYPKRAGSQTLSFRTVTPFVFKELEANAWDLPRNNKGGVVPVYARFSHELDPLAKQAAYRVSVNGTPSVPDSIEIFGSVLRINLSQVEPLDKVTVQASAATKDRYGRPLANPAKAYTVQIPRPDPLVDFPWGFHHLEAAFPPKFIWAGRNLDTLFFGKQAADRFSLDLGEREKANKPLALPISIAKWKPNRVNYTVFDLKPLLNPQGYGTAYFNFKASSNQGQYKFRDGRSFAIQVTDLGITTRVAFNRILVWVNSLSAGTPVAGALVELSQGGGPAIKSATTDKAGFVAIPLENGEFIRHFVGQYQRTSLVVSVSKAGDRADLPFQDSVNTYNATSYAHQLPGRVEAPLSRVLVFTDRGLYKPGEELALRGIHWIQSAYGFKPYTEDFRLELTDFRSGKLLWSQEGTATRNGGFATRFKLPKDLEPGSYFIKYTSKGPSASTNEYYERDSGVSFTVAQFRKLAFELKTSVAERSYYQGDEAAVGVSARYLAGGAMPNAEYSYFWTRKPSPFTPPGPAWGAYVFGPGNWEGEHTLTSGKGKLSGAGQAQLSVRTSDQNAVGSAYQYVLETTVQDIDRQAIAASASVLVHPASFYIGTRFATGGATGWWSRFVATGQNVKLAAVLVDPAGNPWKPATDIMVRVLRADWKATEQQGVYGRINTRWEYTETEVQQASIKAKDGEASWDFQVKQAGDYLLSLEARDAQDRVSKTVIRFYATGSNWVRRATENPSDIEMIADKEEYLPGETAHILVRSPIAEGDYLLTTEREGIYNQKIIHLKGGQSLIDIPVTERHVPVFYVALSAWTKREAPPSDYYDPDLGRPRGLFGIVGLKVSTKPVELELQILPGQKAYQPGKTAELRVRVTRNGQPVAKAELTALAVDRAVLDIINYHIPDPVSFFYDRSNFPLGVEGDDSRRLLMKPVAYDTSALTGGDGGEEKEERKDFRPLALFEPFVLTDEQGEATLSFKLPDNLTTYRLTALAVSGNRVGVSEGELLVQNPINVRAALPRKFRNRDTAAAGVVLQNLSSTSQKVSVSAESSILTIGGEKTRSVEIPPNGVYELPFILSATRPGEGSISFTVRSGVLNEKLTEAVVVEKPLVKEAFTTVGSIAREASLAQEGLLLPSAIALGYGSLSLGASSSLRSSIEPALNRLLDGPESWWGHYQKLLCAFASVYAKQNESWVKGLLKELKDRQQGDGGIYPGSYHFGPYLSDPYLSLLTAHFLEFAASRKFALPDAPDLGRLLAFLGGLQKAPERFDPYFHAYNNFALASGGKADLGYLAKTEAMEDKLGLGGYGLLALAYRAAGDKAGAERVYKRSKNFMQIGTQTIDLKESYEVRNYWSSELAEIALLLWNARSQGEDPGLIQRIAGTLNRSQRHWQGPNDDLWTLLAFIPLLDAEGPGTGETSLSLSTGSQELAAFKLGGASPQGQSSLEFNTKPLAGLPRDQLLPLRWQKQGDSPAYYTMILRYALPNETAMARDEGIEVNLRYETLDGEKRGPRELKLGETYRVRADVSTTKRRARLELLVPIPNGLEIIDPGFATSGSYRDQGGNQSETIEREGAYGDSVEVQAEGYGRWDDGDWSWYWYRPDSFALDNMMVYRWQDFYAGTRTVSFLVRVTTPGIYPTPPASASLEFEPEVFGRSEGSLFVIQP